MSNDVGAIRTISRRLLLAAATVSLLIAAPSSSVRAQQAPSDGAENVEAFERRMARGVEAFKKGNYEQALERFRAARNIADPPTVHYNIGRTLLALNRCEEATRTLEDYLDRNALSEAERRKGSKRLDQAKRACPSTGTLDITCKPESAPAEVWVAGHDADCPATIELEAGTHQLQVSATGYRAYEGRVEIEPDGEVRQVVTLQKQARSAGRAQPPNRDSRAGRRVAQIGGLVVGTGLLAIGMGYDLSARGRLEDFERARRQNDRTRLDQLRREASRARTRTVIFYVAGGVITLGSGTWLAIDLLSRPNQDAEARFRLKLRPDGLAGSFRW